MKHIDEYRDPDLAGKLLHRLAVTVDQPMTFMEVCGTHTVAISKSGLRQALPAQVKLLSGPGCPVCVTANHDIDWAIEVGLQTNAILATFGDMIKVPGSYLSLNTAKAQGADVRVVYSTLDALKIAETNPEREVVFYGVGFETTAPTIAIALIEARRRHLQNFSVYSTHKTVPIALEALLSLGEIKIDGFLCPGHVSVIIGSDAYKPVVEKYHVPSVVAGFEPLDILQAVLMLADQVKSGRAEVEVQYSRVVKPQGNTVALQVLYEVFESSDAEWRGIGVIPGSGLRIREEFSAFDAAHRFSLKLPPIKEHAGCSCGEILRGIKIPTDCPLFAKACDPENPIGPCMVSSEGACAAFYRFERFNLDIMEC